MNRRQFLGTAAALSAATNGATNAAGAAQGAKDIDFEAVRSDFPRVRTEAYLDCASCHPLSVHSAAILHRYVDWATHQVGEP